MSVNKAIILGNVGKTPEIKRTENGITVASFSIATSERAYELQNGTKVPERVEWHNIVAWRGLAEIIEKYVSKGSQLYVEGKITTRSWEKDGIKKYMTEIIADKIELLGGRKTDQQPTLPTDQMTPNPQIANNGWPPAQNVPFTPQQNEQNDLPF